MWTGGQESNLQSLRSRTNHATECLPSLVSQFVKRPPDSVVLVSLRAKNWPRPFRCLGYSKGDLLPVAIAKVSSNLLLFTL